MDAGEARDASLTSASSPWVGGLFQACFHWCLEDAAGDVLSFFFGVVSFGVAWEAEMWEGDFLLLSPVVCRDLWKGWELSQGRPVTITTRQVLGRPVCDRGAIPRTLVQSNVVRSRLIILINEEIIKANWMVSNSAQLDCRTKQHTQFGVSASNGSRDMARTKSWRKKRKKKITKRIRW